MLQCLHENGLFYDRKQLKEAKLVLVQSRKTNSMESSTQYINYGMRFPINVVASWVISQFSMYVDNVLTYRCNDVIWLIQYTLHFILCSTASLRKMNSLHLKYPCNFNIVLSVTWNDCSFVTNKKDNVMKSKWWDSKII